MASETVEDILREMDEATGVPVPYAPTRAIWIDDFRAYVSRLRAAVAGNATTTGNAAKMREALVHCRNCAQMIPPFVQASKPGRSALNAAADYANLILRDVAAALAEPPRNCDVGTPLERTDRYLTFCESHNGCADCPCNKIDGDCEFTWGDMPFEEEATDADK